MSASHPQRPLTIAWNYRKDAKFLWSRKIIIIQCFWCELKAWGISLSQNWLYNMPVQINWRNFFWRTDVMRLLHISRIVRDVMLCLPWPLLKRVTHFMLYRVVYIEIRDIVVPVCLCSQFRVAQNTRTRHGFVLVKSFLGCFLPQSAWLQEMDIKKLIDLQ